MKTSLGIWALGPMITRFVPGGYQPQHGGESTAERVRRAVEGLGDLIDDYGFTILRSCRRRTSTRLARHSPATASTSSRRVCTSTRYLRRAASARPSRGAR